MMNFTVRLPEDLIKRMREHKEVNWSQVIRRSIEEYLKKIAEMERREDPSILLEKLRKLGVDMEDLKPLSYEDEVKLYGEVAKREWSRLGYTTQT